MTIPNTVITIGRDSFYETSIESLIIPSSVLYLSDSSLSNIRNLSSLIFQPGTNIRKLPLGGLARLTSLKNIIIPPSVKIINQTFKDYSEEHEMNMYYCGSADLYGSQIRYYDPDDPEDHLSLKIFVTSNYHHDTLGNIEVQKDDSNKCHPYIIYELQSYRTSSSLIFHFCAHAYILLIKS